MSKSNSSCRGEAMTNNEKVKSGVLKFVTDSIAEQAEITETEGQRLSLLNVAMIKATLCDDNHSQEN